MNETVTTPVAKGLVLSLILVVIAMITYFSGVDMNSGVQYIGYIIFLAGIIFCIAQYGKQINYEATFGNYFTHGFKISAIVTVIMILYIAILIFFFPEFKEKAMEQARANMQANNMPDAQKEQAIEISRKFFTTLVIGTTLVAYLLFGVIASLIGAAVIKKNPANFHHQIDQTA